MRRLCIIVLLACCICGNTFFAFASNELIPSQKSSEQAASVYANISFQQVALETMGEVIGIASDDAGWIYILKDRGGERKIVDIYNSEGKFCSGISYTTASACGLLQLEGAAYLYFVRGQFAFLFENGKLSKSLYSFNDPSGRYAYANYTADCRAFPHGTLSSTSGNFFLKTLGCTSKVDLHSLDNTITIFDATEYCSGKFATIIIFILAFLSAIVVGLVHCFKSLKKKR